jgi:hypothetical protein
VTPPRVPARITHARPILGGNSTVSPTSAIQCVQTSSKIASTESKIHTSTATVSVSKIESVVSRSHIERVENLNTTQEIAVSNVSMNLVSSDATRTKSGGEGRKVEETVSSSVEVSSQDKASVVQREKIQKTKSQELREFTQEFVATSTIDFDPMSFQDHLSPRNKNDTLRSRLTSDKATAKPQQSLAASVAKPIGSLFGSDAVKKVSTDGETVIQSVNSSAPEAIPVNVAEKAVEKEKIVPSDSFMKDLKKLSSSDSSQDESAPIRPTLREDNVTPLLAARIQSSSSNERIVQRDKAADGQVPSELAMTQDGQGQPKVGPVRQDGPSQPKVAPVRQDELSQSKGGPVRLEEQTQLKIEPVVLAREVGQGQSKAEPVRQDLHSTAGAATSSDLLEWAKTILTAYPGLKVRIGTCTGTNITKHAKFLLSCVMCKFMS